MKNKVFRNVLLIVVLCLVVAVSIKELAPLFFSEGDKQPEYELTSEGIIKTEYAEKIINETANNVINLLKDKDLVKLADYVHPLKGVRFTPYTTVSVENDVVFKEENIKDFFMDDNLYVWGIYDGIGDEIKLIPSEYYDKFIYTSDFANVKEIGYNKVLSSGNMLENQFSIYEKAIIVEYYIPEINPQYEGLDWQSLRLVFQEYERSWMLIGIIHNQWTI